MAADLDDANMVRMKGRGPNGSVNRWPRCVIGSGAAHLILLVACVVFQPAPESPRSILRVKLLGGASAPDTTPIVTDVVRQPAPTSVAAPPPKPRRPLRYANPTAPAQPVPASPSVEPLGPSTPALVELPQQPLAQSAAFPQVDAAESPPVVAAPNVVEQPEPPRPSPATRDAGTPGAAGSRDGVRPPIAGGGSGTSPPTPVSAAAPGGAFVYEGQGRASAPGNGSGTGPGHSAGLGSGAGAGGVSGGGDGHAGGSAQVARAGSGAGSGNGAGPGGRNGEQLLRTIRRQIERVWTYPDAARRDGLEGTVWLRFRIGPDGSVEQVEVDRSSGHALLDDAAITAVRRAGPYPSYGGPIRYPFTYRLDR